MDTEILSNKDSFEGETKKQRLVLRHARESWLYPIASVVLNLFGFPFAYLVVFTFVMGIYCLIKSYLNVKNGKGKGIIGHLVAGTILNILFIGANSFVAYVIIFNT